MSVTIESTTDSKEAVQAAIGSLAKKEVVEDKKQSASSETAEAELQDESNEASDTSVNDEDEADSSDSDDDEGLKDESKEEPKQKKKGGFQKRIDKLSSRASKAEQEAEYWRAEALKGKTPDKAPETPQQAKPQIEGKPKAESFDTHEEYVDALTDWKIEQKENERSEKSKQAQVKTEYEKTVQTFQSKVQEFKSKTPDFDETLSDVDDIDMSFGIQEAILSSELGPELMYEISKNRKEYERINGLSAVAAAREIGKIEARLAKSESSEKPEIKITKTPAPIKPVGTSSTKTGKSLEDMSFADYKKARGYA